jgi:hypothetical protein
MTAAKLGRWPRLGHGSWHLGRQQSFDAIRFWAAVQGQSCALRRCMKPADSTTFLKWGVEMTLGASLAERHTTGRLHSESCEHPSISS